MIAGLALEDVWRCAGMKTWWLVEGGPIPALPVGCTWHCRGRLAKGG